MERRGLAQPAFCITTKSAPPAQLAGPSRRLKPPLDQRLQQSDQRPIGGRHFQAIKVDRTHPLQRACVARFHLAAPFAANIEHQQKMPVTKRLAGKTGRGEAAMIDVDIQFFGEFADQRRFGIFAGFQLAARKFP